MERNMEAAQQLGYLNIPAGLRVKGDEIESMPGEKITIVTTGAQGEPMSSLARMAVDDHRTVKVRAGDTVVVSATAIPGNEDAVGRTINHLFQRGANVVYDPIASVHVSGHAYAEELRLMLNIVNPRFVMPVHGEYRMLARYADMAEQMGWPKGDIVRCEIGDIIEVAEDYAKVIGKVPQSGSVLIDGTGVGDVSEVVLRDRQHLGNDGFLVLVVGMDLETGELIVGPEVISRGFVYMDESEHLVNEIKERMIEYFDDRPTGVEIDHSVTSGDIRNLIGKLLYKRTQRRPMILPIILEV